MHRSSSTHKKSSAVELHTNAPKNRLKWARSSFLSSGVKLRASPPPPGSSWAGIGFCAARDRSVMAPKMKMEVRRRATFMVWGNGGGGGASTRMIGKRGGRKVLQGQGDQIEILKNTKLLKIICDQNCQLFSKFFWWHEPNYSDFVVIPVNTCHMHAQYCSHGLKRRGGGGQK